jgi:hypothetical protein
MPDCLLIPLLEVTDTGGENAQQLVFRFVVFLQITWWAVSPWKV